MFAIPWNETLLIRPVKRRLHFNPMTRHTTDTTVCLEPPCIAQILFIGQATLICVL